MALNKRERAVTSEELRVNLELSGLTEADLERNLGISGDQVDAVLEVTAADPIDVWLVRDYLERVILELGRKPVPFTVLTSPARLAAEKWFALYDLDEVLNEN